MSEEMSNDLIVKVFNITKDLANQSITKDSKGYNYNYVDLPALLEKIQPLVDKYRILLQFGFEKEMGYLKIINVDKPSEFLLYTSPIVYADVLKNASPLQDIMAMQTYMRRALLLVAFNIKTEDEVEKNSFSRNEISFEINKKEQNYYNSTAKSGIPISLDVIEELVQKNNWNYEATKILEFCEKHRWTTTKGKPITISWIEFVGNNEAGAKLFK